MLYLVPIFVLRTLVLAFDLCSLEFYQYKYENIREV